MGEYSSTCHGPSVHHRCHIPYEPDCISCLIIIFHASGPRAIATFRDMMVKEEQIFMIRAYGSANPNHKSMSRVIPHFCVKGSVIEVKRELGGDDEFPDIVEGEAQTLGLVTGLAAEAAGDYQEALQWIVQLGCISGQSIEIEEQVQEVERTCCS